MANNSVLRGLYYLPGRGAMGMLSTPFILTADIPKM